MSSCRNISTRVRSGPFVGKTKPELIVLLNAAQAELAEGGDNITSASVNGQQFSAGGGPSVLSRIRIITAALAQVDANFTAPSPTINVTFGNGCGC